MKFLDYVNKIFDFMLRGIASIPILRKAVARLTRLPNLRKWPIVDYFYEKRIQFIMARNMLPELVIIENTNFCNARCILCPHSRMRREKGFMNPELYKKIIDDCAAIGIKRIQLNATGEPLLDKSFSKKIAYAKERGIPETFFFTNAFLLDDKTALDIIAAGPDICIISFYGYDKAPYEKVTGLPFETVKNNALNFLRRNKKRGDKVFTIVSSILLEEDIAYVKKHPLYHEFCRLANKVALIPSEIAHNWAGAVKDERLGKGKRNIARKPCRRLWSSFNILWDGRVNLCDMDCEGEVILGDMNTQSIKEIWSGPVYKKCRESHLRRNYNAIRLCQECVEDVSWWKKHSEDPRRL